MKYGSGGFNPYGYKAGCSFVTGTVEDALTSQYLCSPQERNQSACFYAHSAIGRCNPLVSTSLANDEYDGFFYVDSVRFEENSTCASTSGLGQFTPLLGNDPWKLDRAH